MSRRTKGLRIHPEHTPEQRKDIIAQVHEIARQNIAKAVAARQDAPAIIAKAMEAARERAERAREAMRNQSKPVPPDDPT